MKQSTHHIFSYNLDIPNGTLAALSTSTFLYMIFIIFLGATVDRATLLKDFTIASTISVFAPLFYAGIYVSSMSSCLGAMYGTPRVLQSIANESVIPGMGKLGAGRGANRIPLNAMTLVAIIIIAFLLVGDINTLAPIVTMPFLFTYACIDYSYFALAQTFDIQTKREERFRIQAQSPLYETRNYGATHQSEHHENDLDQLFPERTRHKNLSSPENTPYHQQRPVAEIDINQQLQQDEVMIRDPSNMNSNHIEGQGDDDDEPIAPTRAPIHQKTKNWYSGFCNRWASLMGVRFWQNMLIFHNIEFFISPIGWYQNSHNDSRELGFCAYLFFRRVRHMVLCWHCESCCEAWNC